MKLSTIGPARAVLPPPYEAAVWIMLVTGTPLVVAALVLAVSGRVIDATAWQVRSVADIQATCPNLRPSIRAAAADGRLSWREAESIIADAHERREARNEVAETARTRALIGLPPLPVPASC